jgi:hypothetical protein
MLLFCTSEDGGDDMLGWYYRVVDYHSDCEGEVLGADPIPEVDTAEDGGISAVVSDIASPN